MEKNKPDNEKKKDDYWDTHCKVCGTKLGAFGCFVCNLDEKREK